MVIVAAVDRSDRAPAVIEQAEALALAFDRSVHAVHSLSVSEFVEIEETAVNNTSNVKSMDEVRDFAAEQAER